MARQPSVVLSASEKKAELKKLKAELKLIDNSLKSAAKNLAAAVKANEKSINSLTKQRAKVQSAVDAMAA